MSGLRGADRLIAKFRRLSDVTQRDIVSKAVHHAAKTIVQADAKRLAPGNNGELRNSIKTRVKMDGDKAIGEVYTNLHYAPYVSLAQDQRVRQAILVSLQRSACLIALARGMCMKTKSM